MSELGLHVYPVKLHKLSHQTLVNTVCICMSDFSPLGLLPEDTTNITTRIYCFLLMNDYYIGYALLLEMVADK